MIEPFQVPVVIVPRVVRDVEPARGDAPIELCEMVTAAPPLKVVPDAAPVPELLNVRALGVFAVMVMFAEPLNETPLIVRAVYRVVAVVALPESAPTNVVAFRVARLNVASARLMTLSTMSAS